MSIVFGPVNSRRFGISLGIDLSPQEKSCNFDCIYCELKGAKTKNFISNPPSVQSIITEVKSTLKNTKNIDVITISANGEPTLYTDLKELVNELNLIKKSAKLLILSNGTGVLDPKICESLMNIDIVKFSLDSAILSTFRKIDRGKNIDVNKIISGMIDFRKNFKGSLVLEILVVQGFNDNEKEFDFLNKAINLIKPERVDISTIDRPPAYPVKGVSLERLEQLASQISGVCAIVAKPKESKEKFDFSENEIMQTLKRRPQSQKNIDENFTQLSKQNLQKLIKKQKVYKVDVAGICFYKIYEN